MAEWLSCLLLLGKEVDLWFEVVSIIQRELCLALEEVWTGRLWEKGPQWFGTDLVKEQRHALIRRVGAYSHAKATHQKFKINRKSLFLSAPCDKQTKRRQVQVFQTTENEDIYHICATLCPFWLPSSSSLPNEQKISLTKTQRLCRILFRLLYLTIFI